MRILRNKVFAAALFGKIVTVVCQLIAIRLVFSAAGEQGYAVFALMTGLLTWFLLADFGIAPALQNILSEQRSAQRPEHAYLLAGAAVATLFSLGSCALLYLVSDWLGGRLLFNFSSINDSQAGSIFFVTGSLFLLTATGNVAMRVWFARDNGHLANLVPMFAALISLGLIAYIARFAVGSNHLLSLLVAAYAAPLSLISSTVMLLQCSVALGARQLPSKAELRRLMYRAGQFWIFAVFAAVTLQVDYVVLSQVLTPADINTYSFNSKIFGLVFFVFNALLLAEWPKLTEAIARNAWPVVMHRLRSFLVMGISWVALATAALLLLMPALIGLLAPSGSIVVPVSVILLSGLYFAIRCWTDTFAMVLQSASELKPFWVFVPPQALLSAAGQWVLALKFGIPGLLTGLIASFLITVSWGLPRAFLKLKNRSENQLNTE